MPTSLVHQELHRPRNTRDLRAEMLSLAASLAADAHAEGRLLVTDPLINPATVQGEWDRHLPAIAPGVRERMFLVLKSSVSRDAAQEPSHRLPLMRPNYRHEVLRLLLEADLKQDGPQPIRRLIERIGASQTPIRSAIDGLKRAGIVHTRRGGIALQAEDLSVELLAKLNAQPQTLRFRFERGARIRPPAELLERALPLLASPGPTRWDSLALSGTPVALADTPELDLMGMPRLDLVAHLSRDAKSFDTDVLRQLDDGLEPEPNPLASTPVVLTLVRADVRSVRDAGLERARCASKADVLLSLLDLGLRGQAMQYAKAQRR